MGRKVWADESRRPKTFLSRWANLSRARNTSLSSPSQESKSSPTPSRTPLLPGSFSFLFFLFLPSRRDCLSLLDLLRTSGICICICICISSLSASRPSRPRTCHRCCARTTYLIPDSISSSLVDFRAAESPRKATRPPLSPTGLDDRSLCPRPTPPSSRFKPPPRHEELRGPISEVEFDLVIDWRRTGVTPLSTAEQKQSYPRITYFDSKGATSVRHHAQVDRQPQDGVGSLGYR